MRHLLQVTFQTVTKNSKLTPEFLNSLFIITFLQVAVFGHYYQHSQRPHFATASYEAQDETLQMNQTYETVLKEVLPLLSIYFTDSESQCSFDIQRVTNKISIPNENIFNSLKNKQKYLLIEDFRCTIDSKELPLKALSLFSTEEGYFYPKGGNEMHSIEPDPVNPDSLLGSSHEEDQEKSAQKESLEERKAESSLSEGPIGTIITLSEKKEIRAETVTGENINHKNGPENSPPSAKKEPIFKAFYHYNIPSKSRLLNYWMQLTAPSENVLQKEIPYREALKEIMFSRKFQSFMNEANWFADPEDNEDTKLTISQMHEEAFYDYLRSINWEETEFGTLFECPQIPGKEDFHQAKEDAFNYAYELVGRCAPGLCRDEDFIVRN